MQTDVPDEESAPPQVGTDASNSRSGVRHKWRDWDDYGLVELSVCVRWVVVVVMLRSFVTFTASGRHFFLKIIGDLCFCVKAAVGVIIRLNANVKGVVVIVEAHYVTPWFVASL